MATEWQPIETAPKDGTLILGVDAHSRIFVMEWENSSWLSDSCRDFGGFEYPSHWMPLPEPPK